MPLQRSPPPPTLQVQPPVTPLFSTPLPALFTPQSSSEPSLNVNIDSPNNNISPAITFRNAKRLRLEGDEENGLSATMLEIKEMFRDFKLQQEEKYNKLYSLVNEIRNSVDFMAAKFDEITSRVELLEIERKENLSYIHKLEAKLENFEQSSRSSCIEIRNIPVAKSETKTTLLKTVTDTGNLINLKIHAHEIKDVFRVHTKDPANKTIIVDFTSILRKDEFLDTFRKHNRNSFKLTTEHLKISGPPKQIFVSENLIPRKKRLYFLAREAAKCNDFKFCWIKHGKIFVREREEYKHFEIKTDADLSTILKSA